MPRVYPSDFRRQVNQLARAGTRVKRLAATFPMSDATICSGLKQDRIGRGEAEGATTSQQLELAAVKRWIRHLKTGLAVARKVERGVPSGGDQPKRLYSAIESLIRHGSVRSTRHGHSGVSESGYYDWRGSS